MTWPRLLERHVPVPPVEGLRRRERAVDAAEFRRREALVARSFRTRPESRPRRSPIAATTPRRRPSAGRGLADERPARRAEDRPLEPSDEIRSHRRARGLGSFCSPSRGPTSQSVTRTRRASGENDPAAHATKPGAAPSPITAITRMPTVTPSASRQDQRRHEVDRRRIQDGIVGARFAAFARHGPAAYWSAPERVKPTRHAGPGRSPARMPTMIARIANADKNKHPRQQELDEVDTCNKQLAPGAGPSRSGSTPPINAVVHALVADHPPHPTIASSPIARSIPR